MGNVNTVSHDASNESKCVESINFSMFYTIINAMEIALN